MILQFTVLLVAGGAVLSGSKVYAARKQIKAISLRKSESNQQARTDTPSPQQPPTGVIEEVSSRVGLSDANRRLALSSVSLGLATAGLLFKPLSLVSAPIVLYIFYPSFQGAYQALREERKLTTEVMEATRISVCLIMGYDFAAALDAWLRVLTERVLDRTEEDFNRTLEQQFSDKRDMVRVFSDGVEIEMPLKEVTVGEVIVINAGDLIPVDGTVLHGLAWIDQMSLTGDAAPVCKVSGDLVFGSTTVVSGQMHIKIVSMKEQVAAFDIRNSLQHTVEAGTFSQQFGETSGDKMRPSMLATFVLALPFWRDANRAAGFLTTSFGSQMNVLGPYTLQNFVNLAIQQGILIKDGRALELANLVNTIVIDAHLLSEPTLRAQAKALIDQLRERDWPLQKASGHKLALYVISDGDEIATKQLATEFGFDDYFVAPLLADREATIERLQMEGKFVCYVGNGVEDAVIMKKVQVSVSTGGPATIATDAAQIILIDQHLNQLGSLFDLAEKFTAKQRFNLALPLLMDLVDIGTTVFMHLGLTYSLLFAYSGVLISAINAKLPLIRYQRQESKPVKKSGSNVFSGHQ